VLGPAAGVIGSLQALEALKLLAGLDGALLDAFLQVDLPRTRSCASHVAPGGLPGLRPTSRP
jgi:molybdopterin/thiamine biosynthesis adenylyltransferase